MTEKAMRLALEALEEINKLSVGENAIFLPGEIDGAMEALRQALEQQPANEPMTKLKVTLEDRPIDIELAQYKRMFEDACSALGEVGDALGIDPNEGGAEPILAAIAELKSIQPDGEPIAWMVYTLDGKSVCVTDNPTDFTDEHCALPLYTRPQPADCVSLTDEELEPLCNEWRIVFGSWTYDFARAIEAALRSKNQ